MWVSKKLWVSCGWRNTSPRPSTWPTMHHTALVLQGCGDCVKTGKRCVMVLEAVEMWVCTGC